MSKVSNKFRQNEFNHSELDSLHAFEELIEQEEKEELAMIKALSWICPECSAQNENNIVCPRCFHINGILLEKAEDDEIQIKIITNLTEFLRNSWICPNCASKNYPVSPYCEKCFNVQLTK